MFEFSRSGSSRSSRRRGKTALVGVAGALAVLLLLAGLGILATARRHAQARQAIRNGQVSLEGVRVSWDLAQGSFQATLYLLNNSESKVDGELVVEFSPDPDRLAASYLEELVKKDAPRGEWERLVASLEGRPRLAPKERALLNYLRRGMKADFPAYETTLYDVGQRPNQLVFRKRSGEVSLPPHELTRVVVTQNMPEARMGEEVSEKSTRIVDIKF